MAEWLATRPFSFSFSGGASCDLAFLSRVLAVVDRGRIPVLVRPPFTGTAGSVLERAPAAAVGAADLAGSSSQRALQLEIQHLGLTPERATKFFSLTVGPLPGVSLDGLTRDPNDFDGTPAVIYLFKEWRALTPDQRIAAAS